MRAIFGKKVQVTHGLDESLRQFAEVEKNAEGFSLAAAEFIDGLVSHYVFDGGKLVIAHAGMKAEMQGRGSGKVREFALYGETTGETDEFGLPVRYNWAGEYRGRATVVYGHTPVPEPEWLNHTINVDTGCVFGGKLSALRYPEREIVSVLAAKMYCQPSKPFLPQDMPVALSAQQQNDDVLDIADVSGKHIVSTRLHHNVTIREENAIAALEVMSRFAINPKWLIYLPPTMSPSGTSQEPGLLEHPAQAFEYYRSEGVPKVICEEKHMGSRAVLIVCRDEAAAEKKQFGVRGEGFGVCFTRTGRRFFDDAKVETEFLAIVRDALTSAKIWEEFNSDWIGLDCELMPWSAKAQELLRRQYAAVGSAATAALPEVVKVLEAAKASGIDLGGLAENFESRGAMTRDYVTAYQRYCWPVNSVSDLKLAPFHILATEGATHADKDHLWHMETIKRICEAAEGILLATPFKLVDVLDAESVSAGVRWWEELTGRGGEGMVVKPLNFIEKGRKGIVQPAVKCRGREYLRIIYGPEYTAPQNLERLRSRGLSAKRSLALREFALGVEALERFARKEPLRRVHECVFGVLALESEPVDPRL